MEELAFAMQRAANDARIGINIQQNISEDAKRRCELQRIERRLCFELTDSPLDESAAYLFRPNGSREELPAYKVVRNEDFAYRMARVQTLLSNNHGISAVFHKSPAKPAAICLLNTKNVKSDCLLWMTGFLHFPACRQNTEKIGNG